MLGLLDTSFVSFADGLMFGQGIPLPSPPPAPSPSAEAQDPEPDPHPDPQVSEVTVWHPPQLFWDHLGVTEVPSQMPLWRFLRSHPSHQPRILTPHVEAPSTLSLQVYLFSQKSGTVTFLVPTGLQRYSALTAVVQGLSSLF